MNTIKVLVVTSFVGLLFLSGCQLQSTSPVNEVETKSISEEEVVVEEAEVTQDLIPSVDNFLEPTDDCPQEGFRKTWENLLFLGNGCVYEGVSKKLKFDRRESIMCASDFDTEFAKKDYQLVNECLAKKGQSVFEKTIRYMMLEGEFGEEGKRGGEEVNEWTRFVDNNHLYLFFYGAGGCGGCAWNGAYVVIDLDTGIIQKKSAELPPIGNVMLSPNGKKVIGVEYEFEGQTNKIISQELYHYDLTTLAKTSLIYEVADGTSLVVCGDGTYINKNAFEWVGNERVRISQIKADENGCTMQDWDENSETYLELISTADPIEIKVVP